MPRPRTSAPPPRRLNLSPVLSSSTRVRLTRSTTGVAIANQEGLVVLSRHPGPKSDQDSLVPRGMWMAMKPPNYFPKRRSFNTASAVMAGRSAAFPTHTR